MTDLKKSLFFLSFSLYSMTNFPSWIDDVNDDDDDLERGMIFLSTKETLFWL